MTTNLARIVWVAACAAAIVATSGCSSPAGLAVQMVGQAVDSVETEKLGKELLGQPVSAADAKLGQPADVFAEVDGPRKWRVYPVSLDVMNNQRYVVELADDRIAGIFKAKRDPTGIDVARKMLLDQKVEGKSPSECETALEMGSPLLTVRSETTGMMNQLYDARLIKGMGSPKYCRLRFDENQRCNEVAIIDVGASAGDEPPA